MMKWNEISPQNHFLSLRQKDTGRWKAGRCRCMQGWTHKCGESDKDLSGISWCSVSSSCVSKLLRQKLIKLTKSKLFRILLSHFGITMEFFDLFVDSCVHQDNTLFSVPAASFICFRTTLLKLSFRNKEESAFDLLYFTNYRDTCLYSHLSDFHYKKISMMCVQSCHL